MADIHADVTGADGLARRLITEALNMQRDLERAVEGLGEDAEIIFAAHALHRTGRMARGINSQPAPGGVLVTAHAKNPQSGYDYVGVTRFGHRLRRIFPKRAKALGPIPGIGFRRSVRGFRPKGDWAAKALPEIHREAERASEELGHRILVRLA